MKTVPFRLLALELCSLLAFGGEGDEMLANYLELKTLEIEDSFLGKSITGEDWNELKDDTGNVSAICSGFLATVLDPISRLRLRASWGTDPGRPLPTGGEGPRFRTQGNQPTQKHAGGLIPRLSSVREWVCPSGEPGRLPRGSPPSSGLRPNRAGGP